MPALTHSLLVLSSLLAADPSPVADGAPLSAAIRDLLDAPPPAAALARSPSWESVDFRPVGGDCGCKPPDPCAGPWSGEIGAAFSLESGNNDLFDLHVDAKAAYTRGPSTWSGKVDYHYGEREGEETADHWHGELRYDHKFTALSYAFAQALFERDEISGQDYRIHGLAGYGRVLWQRKDMELKGEVGGGLVVEKYRGSPETVDPSAYAGLDFCKQWGDGSKLTAELDFLPNLGDWDLTGLTLDVDYSKPLAGKLSLTIGLRIEHILDPPGDRESTDVFFDVGLRWSF